MATAVEAGKELTEAISHLVDPKDAKTEVPFEVAADQFKTVFGKVYADSFSLLIDAARRDIERSKQSLEDRLRSVEKENEDLRTRIIRLSTRDENAQKILEKAASKMFGKYTDTGRVQLAFKALKENKDRKKELMKHAAIRMKDREKRIKTESFSMWRSYIMEMGRTHWKAELNSLRKELTEKHEREVTQLRRQLEKAENTVREIRETKASYEAKLRYAFVRGLSVMNMEALNAFESERAPLFGEDPALFDVVAAQQHLEQAIKSSTFGAEDLLPAVPQIPAPHPHPAYLKQQQQEQYIDPNCTLFPPTKDRPRSPTHAVRVIRSSPQSTSSSVHAAHRSSRPRSANKF